MNIIGPKSPSPRLVACLLITTLSLLLSACASAYKMKVDALTSPKPGPTGSYKIVTHDPSVETDSLRYKEVKEAVEVALSAKGMYEAPDPTQADVIIDLDYGINPPELVHEIRSKSIYKKVPGEVYVAGVETSTDSQGNTTSRTITRQDPPWLEYKGEEEYVVLAISYEKYLRLSARENMPSTDDKPAKEVWAVDVTSVGPENNFRKYIPIMAAASIDYIGQKTDGEKSIKLKDRKDSDIAFIKKGPLTRPANSGNETAGRVPAPAPEPEKAGRIPALPFATSSKS